jgi:hypothetical protein
LLSLLGCSADALLRCLGCFWLAFLIISLAVAVVSCHLCGLFVSIYPKSLINNRGAQFSCVSRSLSVGHSKLKNLNRSERSVEVAPKYFLIRNTRTLQQYCSFRPFDTTEYNIVSIEYNSCTKIIKFNARVSVSKKFRTLCSKIL